MYQHSGLFRGSALGYVFQFMGYLSVAMFFFLSGYGLMCSYISKGDNYVYSFPRNRLLPFYLIIAVLIVIYQLFRLFIGKGFDISLFMFSFLFGKTVIGNGWYLQTQLVLYILFYLCFRYCKKYEVESVVVGCCLYCATVAASGYSTTCYESVLAFSLGFLWADHIETIESVVNRRYILLLLGIFALFCVTLIGGNAGVFKSDSIRIPVKMMSALAFVIMVCLIIYIVRIDFPITRWLGDISLEIYVLQGVFLSLFHSKYLRIDNGWLFCLAVASTTILAAYLFHPFLRWIYRTVSDAKR